MSLEQTTMATERDHITHHFWEVANQTIEKYADKEYVVSKKGRLTYREADQHANCVAHSLMSTGLPRQTGVGLLMREPLQIIPAMLGSLKAGHYFIPLDPDFPETTMRAVIESAKIKLIITAAEFQETATRLASNGMMVTHYNEIDLSQKTHPIDIEYTPQDWVQILYTSGSTGTPKGAIEDYRYLTNAAFLKKEINGFTTSDRVMQIPNFTFSGPHTIVFGALLMGLTICFYNVKEDGLAGLAEWINKEQITVFNATATTFRTWAGTLKPDEKFPNVTAAHSGAEKKTHRDLELIRRHFPNVTHFRLSFASTETQAVSSSRVPINYNFEQDNISCGKPHAWNRIFIWDQEGNSVPIGEEGEVVVYSDALARGYINNPELTQERFIPDPENPLFQYFKTGDLGKFTQDGQLVHLGRIDNMIKIKGVRIELNSIEKHMLTYAGILQTAFRVFDDRKGNKKLTAYFTAEAGIQIPISDLRKFLSQRLPAHQLPHFFIQLDQFPVTRTGKLDRNQLPRPAMTRPPLSNPYAAPATELESTLVRIWEEEIGVEGIGVTDDFFEIGGDSLIGVVLFIRIEKSLGRNLPVSTLLKASTIRAQAELISSNASNVFSPLITINPKGKNAPLFFIPGRGGYPTRIRHLAKLIDSETPVYALQDLLERDDFKPLRSVESIAAFYLNEIKKAAPQGPYILVGESLGGKIAFEIALQLKKQGEGEPRLIMLDTYNFDQSTIGKNLPQHYQMLIKKHLHILFGANQEGRVDYLNFYREIFSDKVSSWVKRTRHRLQKKRRTPNELIKGMEERNMRAAQSYKPAAYPGQVILVKALRGPNAGQPTNGWDKVQLGELIVHPLDCYHGSILFEPAVSELAKLLNVYMTGKENKIAP